MRRKSASTLLCTIVLILALFGSVTGAAAETAPAVPVAKASVAISSGMFPDAAFRSYVSSNIDKDSDGTLSESEINAVTTINVSGDGISSLQGIGLFVNLRTLNCMNNQLTSLDISGNPALESLNCSFNYLTELDLSRNPELDYLECESNHLTNLDFSNTRLTQTSTYTLNSSYTITSPFDLSTLPGSFDISRASDWSRGTISGTILTASEGEVTYRYDCGNNCKKTFTLYVSGSALPTYVVTFDANGGSGAPEPQTRTYGENLHLSETIPVRSGYSFIGWSTSPNGTSIQYLPGGIYSGDKDITLYAIWQSDTSSYTISYNANGGTGAPASQTKTHGVTLTLSAAKPTRTGHTFLGWSDSSTATVFKLMAGLFLRA